MERSIIRGDERPRGNRYLRMAAIVTIVLLSVGAGMYASTEGLREVGGYLIAAGTVTLLLTLVLISISRAPRKPYR